MMKNTVIAVLLIAVLAEGGFIVLAEKKSPVPPVMALANTVPQGTDRPKPVMVGKGSKLQGSPIEKFAFKIAPGPLSVEAQTAINGFTLNSMTLKDGSLQVTLTSKDSDDQSQQYTLKKGNSLYFVEMTPVDDTVKDSDANLRDDYGIIVDPSGVIL